MSRDRYEERRDQLEGFVDEHYIRQFDLAPCRMVDIGCGDGFWADMFARRGFIVDGVDRDPAAIETARSYPPPIIPCIEATCLGDTEPVTLLGENPVKYAVLDFDDRDQLAALSVVRPKLIFARTLPHFYQATLDRGELLLERLLAYLAGDDTLILLSIYSNESCRPDRDGQHHHGLAELIHCAIAAGGKLHAAQRVAGYLQIGITRKERYG